MKKQNMTVGDLAAELNVPMWRVRRAVDVVDSNVPRAGQYRLIPPDLLPAIVAEIKRPKKRGARPRVMVATI